MTIRDYIKRRVLFTGILLVLLLLTTLIAASLISVFFINLDLNLTVSIVVPLAIAFTFWRLMHIKCPRCHQNVGLPAAMQQTSHCPHCEISFYQPVGSAETPPTAPPTPLTIRKYVRQRAGLVQIYVMLAIFVIGISIISREETANWSTIAVGLITLVAGMLAAFGVAASTRCPRCLKPLGRSGARLMWKKPANNCPACGVNFDEPVPRRTQ